MAIDYSAFSSDPGKAAKQFRQQYGRDPTASEISGWQAANKKPSGSSGSAMDSAASGGQSNVQAGFGGMKQWEAVEKYGLGPTDVTSLPGMDAIAFDDAGVPDEIVGQKLQSMSDTIDRLSEANASMLRGEIPADVSASVRRAAGEASIAGGIFGGASRALSARDLGRTSMDIKQQGIQNEQGLLEARSTLASAYESIRQYNLTRNATLAELSIKARANNLDAINLERQRIATNIEANVNILQAIAQMAVAQQNIAATAAANDVDPANIIASLDNMIAQFNRKLS